MRASLNFPSLPVTVLYFTIMKHFIIVKAREELSSFGFLHLVAGKFASHRCELCWPERHLWLLHFVLYAFILVSSLIEVKQLNISQQNTHMSSQGLCIPSNCHFLWLTFTWPPSLRHVLILLFLHLGIARSQVSTSVSQELAILPGNSVEML